MVLPNKFRIIFRIISASVAGIFLFQQIAWAGDLIEATLDKQSQAQAETFAPQYLQTQQTIHEDIISQKQTIENTSYTQTLAASSQTQSSDAVSLDLKGPMGGSSGQTTQAVALTAEQNATPPEDGAILSITTESGDIIHYKGNQIDYIEKKEDDGFSIIRRIEGKDFVDADNNLLNAEITYPDGTIMIVSNGKTSKITKPDGAIFHYNADELIERAEYPIIDPATNAIVSYSTVNYSYNVTDTDGQIVTVLTDSEKNTYYDADNKLKRVEFTAGDSQGKVIKYAGGILSEVKEADGTTYVYDGQGADSEYVVRLKTIIDNSGVKYEINNNSITAIDLGNKKISDFEIGEDGKIIKAKIEYYDGTTLQQTVLVENGRIKEITDSNNVRSTYQYDEFAADGNPIKVTFKIYKDGKEETYTYNRDIETNHVKITSGDRAWEYNGAWILLSFTDPSGVIDQRYSPLAIFPPIYIGSTFTLADGTVKEYDKNKNLVKTVLQDGTVYTYYDSGSFQGKLKEAALPDGKTAYYNYEITPEGNLKVYKRASYDKSNSSHSYYSNDYISSTLNPTLKTSFKLDSSKSYPSVNAYASYYNYNDKSVSLSLDIYNNKPRIYYYCYDYNTKKSIYDNKELPLTINTDTAYTLEYVWSSNGVNIYLYESSQGRPLNPLYTIANRDWNPKFSISGYNAEVSLDPSSSGTYTRSGGVSTDYNNPLKGSPIYTSTYKFDSQTLSKSMYYTIYGSSSSSYDSIYFSYYNNTPNLRVYHYDYKTYKNTNTTIPLNITFNKTEYVIQTKLENSTLKLYIYEKGTEPVDPIYTLANVTWDPQIYTNINGGTVDAEAQNRLEVYDYNDESGNLIDLSRTADKEFLTYIYNGAGEITQKEIDLDGGIKRIYDVYNKLLREEKVNGEVTVYDYDAEGNVISITPQFPEGTAYSYYDSGSFQGKLKEATLPDGKIIYYDYGLTEDNNLKVYKRVSYDLNNLYQGAYSNNYISSSLNPTLKASFKLDSAKTYSSLYASAYYYNYNDKSVSLSLNIYSQKPNLYYHYYDYKTKKTVNENKTLDITVNKDVTYNMEYVWTTAGVNIYLYEASNPRPESPVYTISSSSWNPRFSVSGNNANLTLDPSSSGTYTFNKSVSTDYNNPLKSSPIHTTTLTLNSTANYKSLYYSVYGNSTASSDSIYLNYYNNTATLRVYHYDYKTYKYTNSSIPLNVTFKDNTAYVIQTKIENNTLKLYIYEKGTTFANPIYTIDNVTWNPQVYAGINGGDIEVKACDRLETYEYNTTNGIVLDKDVEASLRNKNIVIDDPYSTIPQYALNSGAPSLFPDGKTDILNNAVIDLDFSINLPGNIFDLNGELIKTSDFKNIPYFDTITYDNLKTIKEIVKPNGDRVLYKDGVLYQLQTKSGLTINYNKQGLPESVIKEDKTAITNLRLDLITGEILDADISFSDGTKKTYKDGHLVASELADKTKITYDADGKITSYKTPDGRTVDLSSQTTDENNTIVTLEDPAKGETSTYENGILKEVKDYLNIVTAYKYDENGYLVGATSTKTNTLLHDYSYAYANNLIVATDETGATRTYDLFANQLTKLELPGNRTYLSSKDGDTTVFELETSGETLPNNTIVTIKYDKNNQIIQTIQANGTTTNYANGKIYRVVDNLGNILADYLYNNDGRSVELILLVYDQEKLYSSVEEARLNTLKERDDALQALDKATQDAIDKVEVKYAQGVAEIQSHRESLYSQENDNGYDISQALPQLPKYEEDLKDARDEAYINIDNEKAKKTQEILAKADNELKNLSSWQANAKNQIISQETLAIVGTYYDQMLGRTPSNDEMYYWLDRAINGEEITGTILSSYLESLPEKAERLSQIQRIIDNVKAKLYLYITGSTEEKQQIIQGLGLSESEVIPISPAEYIQITSYLYKQSLKFARGAVGSLKAMLESNGLTVSHEELAGKLILADIVSGSINLETKDERLELQLSSYAIVKIAKFYGLDLSGLKLAYDNLLTQTPPFIAHIDSDKFIVVTDVSDTKIMYIDPSQGTTGEVNALSKENFIDRWDGAIISKDIPQAVNILQDSESKLILGASTENSEDLPQGFYEKILSTGRQVVDNVKEFLYAFLDMSQDEKESVLINLGLTLAQAVSLTKEAVDAITSWLYNQSILAINCATEALYNLFTSIGKNDVSKEEIATDSILIDILAGVITQNSVLADAILSTSLYAIKKVASLKGLDLAASKISMDSLKNLTQSFIANLDLDGDGIGDHYVTITSMTDTLVTYIDSDGKSYCVTLYDFNTQFTGYILSTEKERLQDELPVYKMMAVKGSADDFVVGYFESVWYHYSSSTWAWIDIDWWGRDNNVVVAPDNNNGFFAQARNSYHYKFTWIDEGPGYWILPGEPPYGNGGRSAEIPDANSSGFTGDIRSVWVPDEMPGVWGNLYAPVYIANGRWLTVRAIVNVSLPIVWAAIDTMGKVFNDIGHAIANALGAIGTAVDAAINAFGNLISGIGEFLNTALSGKIPFSLPKENNLADSAFAAMKNIAISNAVSAALNGANFNPFIAGAVGALVSGGFAGSTGSTSGAVELALQKGTELSQIQAVDTLTDEITLDQSSPSWFGSDTDLTLRTGLDDEYNPATLWQDIQNNLSAGIGSINLDYSTEGLNLGDLNLGFSSIRDALNESIQSSTGGTNDVFDSLFDTYKNNALNFLNYGDPLDTRQQGYYASQISDFSNMMEQDFRGALNTYGKSFLNGTAINDILQSGYTLGDYFNERLGSGQYTARTLENGDEVQEVAVKDSQGNTATNVFFRQREGGDTAYWDIVGSENFNVDGSKLFWGEIGIDPYNKLGYTDAELYSIFNSDIQYQRIQNGYQSYAEIKDSSGKALLVIEPTADGHYNVYDSYGEYVDAKINTLLSGKTYSFDDALLNYYQELDPTNSTSLFDVDLSNPDLMGLLFNNLSLSSSDIANYNFTDAQKKQITYILLNGIGNPLGVAPVYMKGLEVELAHADPTGATIRNLAMFPWSGSTDAMVDNVVTWIGNVYLWGHELRDDIVNGMQSQFNGQIPSNMTGLAYSGSGDPLIQAVNANPGWDMKAIVLVNTPLGYNRQITNPNVNNVIMIGGTGDPLSEQGFENQGFDTNPTPLNVYKIALIGVGHTQFSYDPDPNKYHDPVAVQSARFSAEMMRLGNDKTKVDTFLNTQRQLGAITYNETTKIYFVDLEKVMYE